MHAPGRETGIDCFELATACGGQAADGGGCISWISHLGAGEAVLSAQAPGSYSHAGNSSGGHSWQTPAWLLQVLQGVFGIFDLDPCSPTKRRRGAPVSAKGHFTENAESPLLSRIEGLS